MIRVPIWIALLWGPAHIVAGVLAYKASRDGWLQRDDEGERR